MWYLNQPQSRTWPSDTKFVFRSVGQKRANHFLTQATALGHTIRIDTENLGVASIHTSIGTTKPLSSNNGILYSVLRATRSHHHPRMTTSGRLHLQHQRPTSPAQLQLWRLKYIERTVPESNKTALIGLPMCRIVTRRISTETISVFLYF
jgi:hypothetical protein